MPKLDVYGDIQAAVIAFYFPILILTLVYTARYGFSRDAGWTFLFTFSIVRITGGALLVAGELIEPPNVDLLTAAGILESAGLAPLILATIGFLGLAGRKAFSENLSMIRIFRFIALLALAALALTIAGGAITSPAKAKTGRTLRQVGVIVFGAVYVLLAIVHVMCWSYEQFITRRGRNLLIGVTVALPFLGVRIAYAILSVYATPTNKLSKFQHTVRSGDWKVYLIMSLLMEYIAVAIYAIVAAMNTSRRKRS